MFTRLAPAAFLLFAPAAQANVAACEAVTLSELEDGAAQMAGYHDATAFLHSVYDGEPGLALEIDGRPIRGLMCTRRDPLPTPRDLPILASGVPFVISTDFDSAEAPTVTLGIGPGGRAAALMTAGLSAAQEEALERYLDDLPPLRFATSTPENGVPLDGADGGDDEGG